MTYRISPTLALVIALAVWGSSPSAAAQTIRRSQLAGVSQQLGDLRIELVYRRPVARGRPLFGALVPWGRIWSPSADSVARLTLSRPAEINGSRVPAGAYGLWTIPDSTAWTVIISAKPDAFHLHYPEGRDVVRLTARPQHGDHIETLLFAFPMVDADSATLQMRWGTTVVPLTVRALRDPAP
jgi:hypothetical protein